jgi:hypothetical protein
MASGATYTLIATQTLGSNTSTITFSSIPQTYTDLILVANGYTTYTSDFYDAYQFQFNGDTGSNYSSTNFYGDGSSVGSTKSSNLTHMQMGYVATRNTSNNINTAIFHFMNYSNTITYKTVIDRGGDVKGIVMADVGLWRSTSAITSISITDTRGTSFGTGSTLTLYGIVAA